MALEYVTACPICRSTSYPLLFTAKDYTSTGESFSIVKCVGCGFVFTNPRPDQISIGRYYQSKKYISHSGGSQSLLDRAYIFARRITVRWKLRIISKYRSKGNALDYGCGTGEFLMKLQSNRWVVTGVEPSVEAREKAFNLLQIPIYPTLENIHNSKFDIITLWHVLEHVHDLEKILTSLHSLLNDDGIIFIAVPNHESQDATEYKAYWAGYDVPRHLWHFSKNTMKRLLDISGFCLLETLPMKLDAYYVSLLSEGYKNPNQNKLIALLKAFTNAFTSNLAAIENQNYSSIIYIAKRR